MASHCPYFSGKTLTVQLHEQSFDVTVVKTFEPFTLSCALLVELDWPLLKWKGQYVLKLFDRRFAVQLRQDNSALPWTPETEAEYCSFVHNDLAPALFALCIEKETDYAWTATSQTDWDRAQLEGYLQYYCRKSYLTETAVYERLHDLQGEDIPRLMAHVLMNPSSSSGSVSQYLDCPGILLEYIQGFPLTDIEEFAPRASWQHICDEAIRIINRIGERDIRNEDVKTRSFIIRTDPRTGQLKVVMLDFGACVLRKPDQDEQDWREWKAMQDEEGAIGCVMERKLKGGFTYVRSVESERLTDEYQREE